MKKEHQKNDRSNFSSHPHNVAEALKHDIIRPLTGTSLDLTPYGGQSSISSDLTHKSQNELYQDTETKQLTSLSFGKGVSKS
jgi:hypothetical protein